MRRWIGQGMTRPWMLWLAATMLTACPERAEQSAPAPTISSETPTAPANPTPAPAPPRTEPAAAADPAPGPPPTASTAPPVPAEGPRALPPRTHQVGPTGWVYEDRSVPVRTATRAGTELEGELCAVRFAIVDAPPDTRCEALELGERLGCMRREYIAEREEDLDEEDVEGRASIRAQRRARLVARAGTREVAVPAYPVWNVDCVDHVVIITLGPFDFTSHRAFVGIDTHEGAIVRAREVSIDDAHEGESECGNAWDGVDLAPIVAPTGLVGALVIGAMASPRFELGVGEIGPSGVVAGDEPIAGYRLRDGLLVGIPRDQARPAECPIVVDDRDGETNVRSLPNTGRPPIGTVPNGTRLDPVEQRGRWYRIESPTRGWVFATSLARRCDEEDAER